MTTIVQPRSFAFDAPAQAERASTRSTIALVLALAVAAAQFGGWLRHTVAEHAGDARDAEAELFPGTYLD